MKICWKYHHFTHVHHKWQSYEEWFLRYQAWHTEFFVILDPKNQNFEKMKKTHGKKRISLHMCAINENHMIYGSWDMKCDEQNFLYFWTSFCSFTPIMTRKIKFWKTEKNTWRYHHFTQVYQKSWSYPILLLRYGA